MRTIFCVGMKGFEPSTSWSQTRCASRTAPHPVQKRMNHKCCPFLRVQKYCYFFNCAREQGKIFAFVVLLLSDDIIETECISSKKSDNGVSEHRSNCAGLLAYTIKGTDYLFCSLLIASNKGMRTKLRCKI